MSQNSAQLQKSLEQAFQYHQQKDYARAETQYRLVMQQFPNDPNAIHYLGLLLCDTGHDAEGLELVQRSIRMAPKEVAFVNNLAAQYIRQNNYTDAMSLLKKVVESHPNYDDALRNLASCYAHQHDYRAALEYVLRAININPNSIDALTSCSVFYHELGMTQHALPILEKILQIDPKNIDAHFNLAAAYATLNQYQKCIDVLTRLHAFNQTHALSYHILAENLMHLNQPDAAYEAIKKAYALNPELHLITATMFFIKRRLADWTNWYELQEKMEQQSYQAISQKTEIAEKIMSAYVRTMNKQYLHDIAKNYTDDEVKQILLKAPLKPFIHVPRTRGEKLRIGYMSANFRNHANMHLMGPAFKCHDRKLVEVFAYSHTKADDMKYMDYAATGADHFIDVQDLTPWAIAERIRADDIDILINLNGYTQNNKMNVLAFRPAPVQVVYLGFPCTTGADFVDYMIVDEMVCPRDHQPFYAEKFAYLPHTYQMNHQDQPKSSRSFTREEFGLPQNAFVFACFNSLYKFEPGIFEVWTQILKQVPNSVLWLLVDYETTQNNLRKFVADRGIDPNRLVFSKNFTKGEHLERIKLADLFIDSFIVNAHVTTSDALWSGLPVLTKLGEHFTSRVAASLLHAVGLDDMITYSTKEYIDKAVHLATHPDDLAAIKNRLHNNRLTYPLFNQPMRVQHLEKLYHKMWQRFEQGLSPDIIDLNDQI